MLAYFDQWIQSSPNVPGVLLDIKGERDVFQILRELLYAVQELRKENEELYLELSILRQKSKQ